MRWLVCALLVLVFGAQAAAVLAQNAIYRGRPLDSVLGELRANGAPLVYSSNLVPRRLRVEKEPSATEPLALARELLAQHGLGIEESAGAWLVVRVAPSAPPQAPGGITVAAVAAADAGPIGDAIVQLDAPNGPSVALVNGRALFRDVAAGRHTLTVRAPGFLPDRASVDVPAAATADVALELVAAAPPLEELTVTASRYDLHTEVQPSSTYLSQAQIENLVALGGDALRAAHRLPGIAANEFSSRSHVRGGAADEMTVILDGMKLFEPFHLRDYQSVFSAIDQRIVSGIEIYSGGFPVAYGDALSGLTVIDQLEPSEPLEHEVGLSLLYTSLLSTGKFDDGRAQWLVSVRRGNIDKLLEEEIGKPAYGDAFLHLGFTLGPKHRLALNDIGFDDDIVLTPGRSPGDTEQARSETDNNQFWIKIDSEWTSKLSSRSLAYSTDFKALRRGAVADDEIVGVVSDGRGLDALGLKQDWRWAASERQLLTFGFESERLDGSYAYTSVVDSRSVLATLETEPRRSRAHTLAPSGDSHGLYVSDRVRLSDRAIADLGMRWDDQTYLPPGDDEQFSPRGSFLYRLGGRTDLRFSYGKFFQSESLIDLQVEDDIVAFAPAQSASHSIAGFEHRFARDLALRVEMFRKWTSNARPRYENLFDPLALLPELRPGRVRIAPERAESRGLEVLISRSGELEWWAGYSFARAVDIVGGERIARSWDQRHALSGGATANVGPWNLSAVLSLHTGWPATTLELVPSGAPSAVDGMIAVAGPRNGDRLPAVRRVDFRVSRTFEAGPGTLRLFAELTNVTDRSNPCCVRYEAATGSDGTLDLERIERESLPLTGNIGVVWRF